jgi:hypothetical protein
MRWGLFIILGVFVVFTISGCTSGPSPGTEDIKADQGDIKRYLLTDMEVESVGIPVIRSSRSTTGSINPGADAEAHSYFFLEYSDPGVRDMNHNVVVFSTPEAALHVYDSTISLYNRLIDSAVELNHTYNEFDTSIGDKSFLYSLDDKNETNRLIETHLQFVKGIHLVRINIMSDENDYSSQLAQLGKIAESKL